MSPRALAALGRMGLQSLPGHRVNGLRVVDERTAAFRWDDFSAHYAPHMGMVIAREVLDDHLLACARRAGADHVAGEAVELIHRNGRVTGVTIQTSSGIRHVRARTVVAATGSALGTRLYGRVSARHSWGIAGRTYVELAAPAGSDLELHFPVSHDERSLAGYAWMFPAGPRRVNIGVGIFQPPTGRAIPLRRLVRDFVSRRLATDPRFRRARVCGPIATGAIAVEPLVEVRPGLIPVGDLAGVANLLTGEGIAAALESAECAAEALRSGGDQADASFRELLRERFPRHRRMQPALAAVYGRPGLFLDRGCDLISSAAGPANRMLWRLAWDEAPAAMWWLPEHPPMVRTQVEMAGHDALRTARRMRPLLGELLAYLIAEPATGFGWHAAFAAAVHSAVHPDERQPSAVRRSVVLALEVLNLVAVLHRDDFEDARVAKAAGAEGLWAHARRHPHGGGFESHLRVGVRLVARNRRRSPTLSTRGGQPASAGDERERRARREPPGTVPSRGASWARTGCVQRRVVGAQRSRRRAGTAPRPGGSLEAGARTRLVFARPVARAHAARASRCPGTHAIMVATVPCGIGTTGGRESPGSQLVLAAQQRAGGRAPP